MTEANWKCILKSIHILGKKRKIYGIYQRGIIDMPKVRGNEWLRHSQRVTNDIIEGDCMESD